MPNEVITDMDCNCVECRVLSGEASSGEVSRVIRSWRKDRKRSIYRWLIMDSGELS